MRNAGCRVILVKPEYGENIGYTARAMKNFGSRDLVLVSPRCEHTSVLARSRAMKGKEILLSAKVVKSLSAALRGVDFSAATTARAALTEKLTRSPITAREFAQNHAGAKNRANSGMRLAVVFGPEKDGLTNAEIALCDFVVEIPASRSYPTLNLGHAAAVVLYELHCAGLGARGRKNKSRHLRAAEKERLLARFNDLIHAGQKIRNKDAVLAAFRSAISRSPVTEKEGRAIIAVFDSVLKRIRGTRRRGAKNNN
ncbi:MAG: TrmJ/YjtD family RNA methyltransferase [Candidatus Diapherotrites archaeon]